MNIIFILLVLLFYSVILCLEKRFLNGFIIICCGYISAVVLNFLYFSKIGFNELSDFSIIVNVIGISCSFFGCIFANIFFKNHCINEKQNLDISLKFIIPLLFIAILNVVFLLIDNFDKLSEDDYDKFWFITRHIFCIFPIISILCIKKIIDKKDIEAGIFLVIVYILTFLSFVKYHIISILLADWFFIYFYRYKLSVKYSKYVIVFVLIAFCANYYVSFLLSGQTVDSEFYINHLWKYIAGGTINVNYIVEQNNIFKHGDFGVADWLFSQLLEFPGMIINCLLNINITFRTYDIPMLAVNAYTNEESNVVNAFGIILMHSDNIFEYIICCFILYFIAAMVLRFGSVTYNIYCKALCSIVAPFFTLTFFANFFSLSQPWEYLFWGAVLPIIFRNKDIRNRNESAYRS